jgi:nucleoside-diphosphate-sugar epimerase
MMRIFISGATGILGRRVVKLLTESGHQVVGLSRSKENADWISVHSAEAKSGNLFDQDELCEISSGCNAFLHLATAIPTRSGANLADWNLNDRIRREGTKNMIEVALYNNCHLFITQSVLYVYGDRKGDWVDENSSIPTHQASIIQSAVDMEQLVRDAMIERDLPAILLRNGSFYCYDSAQTRAMFESTKAGTYPVMGDGEVYWNIINVDDAANAVHKAVENYKNGLGHIFNVCDDEPVLYRDLLNFVAETLGSEKPRHIPVSQAESSLGSHLVEILLASVRCKNQLIKEKLGWAPRYSTYREGYSAEIDKWLRTEEMR